MHVRFFFAPASEPFFRTCLEYLKAFQGAADRCRAVMLMGAPLTLLEVDDAIVAALRDQVGDDYINVVAAPPHTQMGAPLTARDMAPPPDMRDASGYAQDLHIAATVGDSTVYAPQTALAQYHTADRVNIAIVGPLPDELDEAEYEVLKTYDAILASSGDEAMELVRHNLRGFHVLAKPTSLRTLLEGLC